MTIPQAAALATVCLAFACSSPEPTPAKDASVATDGLGGDSVGTLDASGSPCSPANCNDNNPCTVDSCDGKYGCESTPLPAGATCEGDGVACTVENCDGQGGCGKLGKATDSLCDDKVACTLDKCDPAKGCVFEAQDVNCADGNACTADKCDAKTGCVNSNLTDGTACVADELDCTTDACSAGLCKASIKADFCVIASKCQAGGATSNGGCKSCSPKASQLDWTNAQDNSPCTDDGIACSTDTCAAGSCNHAPQHSKCDDGTACTADLCDLAKGCQNPDACPWGHGCDKTANACLTTGGKAIELTASTASEPNPTNPTLARHELEAGGQRTWVAWQTDSCMAVENGGWVVKKPARLMAMPLDPQLVAPAQKVKPQAITLPVAKFFGSSTGVCQAFAQAATDPLVPNQAWLAWLEADPSQTEAAKACLGSGGQGGVMRVARLDGKSAAGSVEVAGEVCTKSVGAIGPLFLTQGLAMLDGQSANLTDINLRGLLSVRPGGASLGEWNSSIGIKSKSIGDTSPAVSANAPTAFAMVRPVLADFGLTALADQRYLTLGVDDDNAGLHLWGSYVKADGAKGSLASWTTETPAKEVFANATAVCSIDATVNPAGTLGIVVVLRKGTQDEVVLLTRDTLGQVTAVQVASSPSIEASTTDCRTGLTAARVQFGTNWSVAVLNTTDVISMGSVQGYSITAGKASPLTKWAFSAATTDTWDSGSQPTNSLAWRGLATAHFAGSAVFSVYETYVKTSLSRSIRMMSFLP